MSAAACFVAHSCAAFVGTSMTSFVRPGSFAFSGHDRTHAHQILTDRAGRFVLHVDLGLDKIYVWKFDAEKGVLTANDPPAVALSVAVMPSAPGL